MKTKSLNVIFQKGDTTDSIGSVERSKLVITDYEERPEYIEIRKNRVGNAVINVQFKDDECWVGTMSELRKKLLK